MTQIEWLIQQLKALEAQQTLFVDRSLMRELQRFTHEQDLRIDQAKGEIDGRMWNPSTW